MSKDSSNHSKLSYGPFMAISMVLAGYFGAYLVFLLVAGSVLSVVSLFTDKTQVELAGNIDGSTAGQFISTLAVYSFMMAIVYAFMKHRKVSWPQIGLGRKPRWMDFAIAIATFFGYYIILSVILAGVSVFLPGVNLNQEQKLGFDTNTHGPALILIFLSLAILPPLVEEIVMRGFLYSGLRRRFKILPAALITSFIFSIAHLQLGEGAPPLYVAAIDTFVLSMFLVFLRERTGSLWAGIFVHGIKNTAAFLALFVFMVG